MRVNDKVEWTSQAGGYTRMKDGVIVAVVPAKAEVRDHLPSGCRIDGPGRPRNHESYLVQVKSSTTLYWPVVAKLRPLGPTLAQLVCDAAIAYRNACNSPSKDSITIQNRRMLLFDVLKAYEESAKASSRAA